MDRILLIRYGSGKMVIDVNKFFPTSRTRIRKLGKIMAKDYDHDLKAELLQMLEDRVNEIREDLKDNQVDLDRLGPQVDLAVLEAYRRGKLVQAMRKNHDPRDQIAEAIEKRNDAMEKAKDKKALLREATTRRSRLEKEGIALLEDIQVVRNEI